MKTNKITSGLDNLIKDLNGMKCEDINLQDIKTIKSDLQVFKENLEKFESVIDAYLIVLE